MVEFSEDLLEQIGGSTGAGLGAVIAAAVLAPKVARPLGRGLRSLAKGAIKGYLVVSARTRSAVTEASEEWQQLYAEVKSEVAREVSSRNGHDVEAAAALSMGAAQTEGQFPAPGSQLPAADDGRPTTDDRRLATPSTLVNLNEADREALMTLPGVGERTAEKILQYRQEHGRIRSLQELLDADVLHGHVSENLRDRVTT